MLSIELLALVTVAQGDAAEAAVLQGAAASLWPSVGLPLCGSPPTTTPRTNCARRRSGGQGWATSGPRGVYDWAGRSGGRPRSRALGRARPLDGLPAPRDSERHGEAAPDMQQPAASPTREGGETAG
ncbi:hypothetical protein ABZT02_33310 [Streptomyces sp. NPDC005402]|uniref:hypothetical protein n=1 Tax=Streptomyces sp. NPDC005402 TaxID=3155338 RepID=UPI0033A72007